MLEIEAMIHEAYIKEQANKDPWNDSPYKDLLKLTIDQRGKIGENIVAHTGGLLTEAFDHSIGNGITVEHGNKKGIEL